MNVWSEILEMLAKDNGLRELLIAPNAPPLGRDRDVCAVISGRVFSAEDVAETLAGVAMRASGKKHGDLSHAGVMCVGIRDIGRLRISYLTQRGSRVVRIVRIPFDVPDLHTICAEPRQALDLAGAIGAHTCRAVLIHGTSQAANSQAAYAILGEINKTLRKVIYIIEPRLSYLLAHGNSLVLQSEIETDVPSVEDGIRHAFLLDPDVVYLGDLQMTDEVPSLPQLFSSVTSVVVSALAEDPGPLLARLPPPTARDSGRHPAACLLKVWAEPKGRIRLETAPWPQPARNGAAKGK